MDPQHNAIGPLSFGTVEDEEPVEFDPERGPLVNVALQPSRVPVRCRVLMRVAGNGEGDYHPFVPGDEVLVALPQGPRGECAILGKVSNATDAFPTSVAGQDSTANAFSFERRRTAHLVECEGSWGVWTQPTGAFIGLSKDGVFTARDGARNSLQLSADALAYLSADAKHLMQLNVTDGRFHVQTDEAIFVLGADGAIQIPGTLTLASAGNPAHEHAVSTEAVYAILHAWNQILFAGIAFAWAGIVTPAQGAPLGPLLSAPLATVFSSAALALSVASAGTLPPDVALAVFAAFQASAQKPPGVPGQGQLSPGIGCPGTMVG
jgi:hypothetical protein